MQPSETQYDPHKKLVYRLKRDRKIHNAILIAATVILLADIVYIFFLVVTLTPHR